MIKDDGSVIHFNNPKVNKLGVFFIFPGTSHHLVSDPRYKLHWPPTLLLSPDTQRTNVSAPQAERLYLPSLISIIVLGNCNNFLTCKKNSVLSPLSLCQDML